MKRVEGQLDRGEEERKRGASVAEVLRIENSWDCCNGEKISSLLSFFFFSPFVFQRTRGWNDSRVEMIWKEVS